MVAGDGGGGSGRGWWLLDGLGACWGREVVVMIGGGSWGWRWW